MIYEINGNISLIVPRKNATAGLHRVNAGYMERNTETLELKEIFTFLRASFYAQMKIIEEGYLFIEENLVLPDKIKARTVEIDGDESEIGHIFINQDEWTEEDDQVDLLKLADMIEIFHNDIKLLEDVAENSTSRRKREAPLQFDEMEFDFVEVTDELILMDPGNSSFEADRLEIDGDLSVKIINDKDWKEFEKTLIRMDRNDTLENLVVDGDVIFENELIVENLNDKSLKNEYLWSNIESFETVKVSGLKRFENILTNDIDTDGFINGVRPSDFISLSGNQTIHGRLSSQISWSSKEQSMEEALKIFYQTMIYGQQESLSPDASLIQSNEIIEINSLKTFESLTATKVVVESGELNNIPLENFVSKTRPQELQITNFKGIIVTNFLDIKGLVDGVNPKEFFEDCVYTNDSNSDIHLNITAIFEEDIEADEFQVFKIFNNRPVHDLITTDNLTDHFEKFTFQKLRVDTMDCECDVEGVGILNGVDIRTVKARSFKAPAHPQHLYVDHLVLRKGLNVSRINTIPMETITKYLDSLQDLPEMLKSGRLSVDTIVVKGNALHFEKNMYINGQLNDDSQTFPEFISQIAFKTEDYIQLRGKSEFLYEVLCHDNIFVEEMNGIPFSDIAMKTTPIEFAEDLEIHGNLHVNNLVVKENLNNHSIAELPHLCRFDNYLNTWVFGGPLLFKGHVEIENLILRSSVNDVDDMEELLNSLTYINQISVLKGKTIFKNEVSINKGGFIKHLNGFDLMDVLNNMVFISGSHQVKISGPVVFQGPVKATHVTIKSGLISENINDCDVGEWVEDSVKINEDIKLNGMCFDYISCINKQIRIILNL
uniref:Uncharacterized protein n=1 Tax=Megaselia scalaris TaxID=36166 RepID=T1GG17_MEGSC